MAARACDGAAMQLAGIAHVQLTVSDLARSRPFYRALCQHFEMHCQYRRCLSRGRRRCCRKRRQRRDALEASEAASLETAAAELPRQAAALAQAGRPGLERCGR